MDESVASLPLQTNIALQSARLDLMKRATEKQDPASLTPEAKAGYAKAARGFESMFVHEMYKTMRESMLAKDSKEQEEDNEMGFGNDALEGFTDLQFSDYVSQNGRGMGLAEMMYKHLSGDSNLPQMVTQSAFVPPTVNATPKNSSSPVSTTLKDSTSAADNLQESGGSFIAKMNDKLGRFDPYIQSASEQYGVPDTLIKAIITAESAANPNAVSPVGAKGLMQLMNGTAKDLDVKNPFDPKQNIKGGTEYISRMIKQFGNLDHAVAAYNAGPGNVEKHNGVPPFAETQAYVRKVRRYMHQYSALAQSNTSITDEMTTTE